MPAAAALFLLGLALAAPAPATPVQNLDALASAARHWLAAALPHTHGDQRIVIQPPDPRLRLPRCAHLVFSRLDPGADSGRIAVRARCNRPTWQLYLSASVTVTVTAIVARRALAAGTRLSRSDLERARRPLSSLPPNAAGSTSAAVGHVLMHSVAAGSPITAAALALPLAVHRGDQLTIVASGDGVSLSVAGVAMENGRPGQSILVRNTSSGRVLHATVTGPHRVKVTF